ncbi:MAG: diacylglycerol kinase family protein [Bacteroidetes bacterium]|nr:diacylglycerol kinase family protein [Bacteroidota bacterium]
MKTKKLMSVQGRMGSIGYALQGIRELMKEPNAKIHLAATLFVIISGIASRVSVMEWIALAVVMGMVWMAEAFNTAMEKFCDLATEGQYHPVVKIIKDVSAAAVLITAITAIVTGIFVFIF